MILPRSPIARACAGELRARRRIALLLVAALAFLLGVCLAGLWIFTERHEGQALVSATHLFVTFALFTALVCAVATASMHRFNSWVGPMARRATQDLLTGLPNRAAFKSLLRASLRVASEGRSQPVVVCFVDCDGFKQVNDLYGHKVADRFLRVVARRLRSVARRDDFVARLGGDEFVLVAHHLHGAEAVETLLRRILSVASSPVVIGDLHLPLSVSVGAAESRGNSDTAESLLACADKAMYEAKRAGGNRWVVWHAQATH